jgi:hypothetical protein
LSSKPPPLNVPLATVPFTCGCRFKVEADGGVWRRATPVRQLEVNCPQHGRTTGVWAELINRLYTEKRYLPHSKEAPSLKGDA